MNKKTEQHLVSLNELVPDASQTELDFLTLYIASGEKVQSAMKARPELEYVAASVWASRVLKRYKQVRVAILEKKGITLDIVIDGYLAGLKATKVISATVTGKDADGGTKDFIEVPDYAVRKTYLDKGLELLGEDSTKTKEEEDNVTPPMTFNQFNFGETGEMRERFTDFIEKTTLGVKSEKVIEDDRT